MSCPGCSRIARQWPTTARSEWPDIAPVDGVRGRKNDAVVSSADRGARIISPMTVRELSRRSSAGSQSVPSGPRKERRSRRLDRQAERQDGGSVERVMTLSGGNQQKVPSDAPRADRGARAGEPTAGVDIAPATPSTTSSPSRCARSEVIVASSDVGDLLVVHADPRAQDGVVAREMPAAGPTEHQLAHAMEGLRARHRGQPPTSAPTRHDRREPMSQEAYAVSTDREGVPVAVEHRRRLRAARHDRALLDLGAGHLPEWDTPGRS